MKVAVVYDRANKIGGAERLLLHLSEVFPKADLFTSVYSTDEAIWAKKYKKVYTSFLQNIPFARNNHEFFSFLMPLAFESFNFSKYDLVISVTSEYSKSIITGSKTKHISIILTPTRYLWSGYFDYFKNRYLRKIASPVVSYLKFFDKTASKRPEKLIAISKEVQVRIKKYYGENSELLYPPLTKLPSGKLKIKKKNFYLVVSRLVSYKKVDLVVKAFNSSKKNLVVIGTGKQEKYLKKIANNNNIHFLGRLTDMELSNYYRSAKALVFPTDEDFGLVPIESQYFGTPVIAFAKGGALETIVDKKTGVFFDNQTPKSIIKAIKNFEKMRFNKKTIKDNAVRFSFENFEKKLLNIINSL